MNLLHGELGYLDKILILKGCHSFLLAVFDTRKSFLKGPDKCDYLVMLIYDLELLAA